MFHLSLPARAIAAIALLAIISAPQRASGDEPRLLFCEHFDDAGLLQRGWYDGNRFNISKRAPYRGAGCIEFGWREGGTTPVDSSTIRHLFEPTGQVYLRFYIRLSRNWGWTGRNYHPHLTHFLTTENGKYHGPAASHLTLRRTGQREAASCRDRHSEQGRAARVDAGAASRRL